MAVLASSICLSPPIAAHPILFFRVAELVVLVGVAIVSSGERRPMHLLLVKNDLLILLLDTPSYCSVTQAITDCRILDGPEHGRVLVIVLPHRLLLLPSSWFLGGRFILASLMTVS